MHILTMDASPPARPISMPAMHIGKVSKSATAPFESYHLMTNMLKPLRAAFAPDLAARHRVLWHSMPCNLRCLTPHEHTHALRVLSAVKDRTITHAYTQRLSILIASVCCVRRRHRPSRIAGAMTSSATAATRPAAGSGPQAARRQFPLRINSRFYCDIQHGVDVPPAGAASACADLSECFPAAHLAASDYGLFFSYVDASSNEPRAAVLRAKWRPCACC